MRRKLRDVQLIHAPEIIRSEVPGTNISSLRISEDVDISTTLKEFQKSIMNNLERMAQQVPRKNFKR
jgi:hypothetical protein